MTSQPDSTAEWWNTSDVASYLGVQVGTVSSYRLRGQMPVPDATVGRTQLWRPARIIEWHESRPRPGVGGRPVGQPQSGQADPQRSERPDGDSSAWQEHGRRWLYENRWVRLGLADIEQPDGTRFEHHIVWMPSAAMTALLDDAEERVLLLWRHRFVADVWNWELPGGLVEEGEDPAETATRECVEETGWRPRRLTHAVTFEPMVGMVTSPHHVFIGHGAEQVGEPTEINEMQRMEWVPMADIPQLIEEGSVRNSGTLVALLHVLALSGPDAPGRSIEAD